MSKRPTNMETLLLALELLKRIPRSRKITAADLHAQLSSGGIQRDLRTIQRQLELLSAHFDIERDDSSKPYGYRWKANAAGLAVPLLSEQESLLLKSEHGRRIVELRREKDNLLDTVWLATSSQQIKDLWTKVGELLQDEPTRLEREAIALPSIAE